MYLIQSTTKLCEILTYLVYMSFFDLIVQGGHKVHLQTKNRILLNIETNTKSATAQRYSDTLTNLNLLQPRSVSN